MVYRRSRSLGNSSSFATLGGPQPEQQLGRRHIVVRSQCFFPFILLSLHFPVSLSYFDLTVPMLKCSENASA